MDLIIDILAIVGGAGIIIFGLSKFLGSVWRDRIKEKERRRTEEAMEFRRQRLGLRRVQADRFAETQFDVYIELWQTLQGLRLAVDALWQRATKRNIATLASELSETKEKIQKWSVFFEASHYSKLLRMLQTLENYRAGKFRLVQIRSEEDMDFVDPEVLRYQIEENREYKQDFETLLEEMRQSFQDRLSAVE